MPVVGERLEKGLRERSARMEARHVAVAQSAYPQVASARGTTRTHLAARGRENTRRTSRGFARTRGEERRGEKVDANARIIYGKFARRRARRAAKYEMQNANCRWTRFVPEWPG